MKRPALYTAVVIHPLLLGKRVSPGLPSLEGSTVAEEVIYFSFKKILYRFFFFTILKLDTNCILQTYSLESCFFSYTLCFGCLSISGRVPVSFNCHMLFHCVDKLCFINLPVDGYLDCLPLLVLWRIAQWATIFMSRIGLAGSGARAPPHCSLLLVAPHSGWIHFCIPLKHMRAALSHGAQHLLSRDILIFAYLMGIKYYAALIIIQISQMVVKLSIFFTCL